MLLKTDLDRISEILEGLLSFIDHSILPLELKDEALFTDHRRLYAEDGSFSSDVRRLKQQARQLSAKAGFYTMCVPEELGGGGQGALLHLLAWERLYRTYGPVRMLPYDTLAHWARGPSHLFLEVSDRLKATVLPGLLDGSTSMCFALSEPDAGSDTWNIRTSADSKDESYILNGTKQWSTNGPTADHALVFAVTDRELAHQRKGGITAFLLPTDSPGFRIDSVIKLFGSIGGDEAIISLNDVEVPADSIVGPIDNGFSLALDGILLGRMYNAGRGIGLARWALEHATTYAKERQTFGHSISEYQGVQFQLVDAATGIYASRCMALDCARKIEAGVNVRKELAMVKVYTTEASFQAIDRCMQVCGGMGLTNELGMYEGWHVARISRIADGSGEIMRRTVARQLLRGDLDF